MRESSTALCDFIEAAKQKGASDEFLTHLLLHRGWSKDDIFAALATYWEHVTGLSVPGRSGHGESSRDAFLYLLSFSTLAIWASALGSMLFQFIDHWFPDPVSSVVYNLRTTVTWQMACIAVGFPIFVLVTRTIVLEIQSDPDRLQSGVRKWLTYIALLLTAGGIISDLICFLDYFLKGELTTRFILKALAVMLICAAIFFYYLGSLRSRKSGRTNEIRRSVSFGIAATLAVVVSVCVGMGMAGTPSQQRHIEADTKRVQDLSSIAGAVHNWYEGSGHTLPPSLSALVKHGISESQMTDPETKAPYEYRPMADSRYQLCAAFAAPTEQGLRALTQFWDHGEGRTCFTVEAFSIHSY